MPNLGKFDNLVGTEERLCCLISGGMVSKLKLADRELLDEGRLLVR